MSLFKQFETDRNLEKSGIVVEYGPNKDLPVDPVTGDHPAIQFRIARAGGANEQYTKRLEVLAKKHRRAIQNEMIETATLLKMTQQAFVDTVLLGWENVTDRNGDVMPFNTENALALFKQLPDLFIDLQEQANKAALFRCEVREADAGN
jgi:hypothetical protein